MGDMSGDLMDLTAILSYERDTDYVIKDKMSDIYTCARMYACHIIQIRLVEFPCFGK